MDDQFITLDWKGQDKRLARKKVMAVALAGAKPADQAAGRLVAGDGSVLAFTKIELAGSKFALQSPTGGALQIPQAGVARIRLASDKIANLLDLTPTSARHYGLLDAGFPHRVNRSAGGKPEPRRQATPPGWACTASASSPTNWAAPTPSSSARPASTTPSDPPATRS